MPETSETNRWLGISRLVLACYWLGLFITSHIPRTPRLLPFEHGDKVMHLLTYAILAMLCALHASLKGPLNARRLLAIAGMIAAYGVADELLQIPVPGRSCDVLDWIADLVGIVCGLTSFVLLRQGTGLLRAEGIPATKSRRG